MEPRASLVVRISPTFVLFFNCADELTKYRPQSSQSLSPHPHVPELGTLLALVVGFEAMEVQCELSVDTAASTSCAGKLVACRVVLGSCKPPGVRLATLLKSLNGITK